MISTEGFLSDTAYFGTWHPSNLSALCRSGGYLLQKWHSSKSLSRQTEIGGSDRDGNNLQRGKERKGNSLLTGLTRYFHNAVPIRNFNIIMIKSQTCNIRNWYMRRGYENTVKVTSWITTLRFHASESVKTHFQTLNGPVLWHHMTFLNCYSQTTPTLVSSAYSVIWVAYN